MISRGSCLSDVGLLSNFILPQSISINELSHYPVELIQQRLNSINQELKLLKKLKREKTKSIDFGEEASFLRMKGKEPNDLSPLSPKKRMVSNFLKMQRLNSNGTYRNSISVTHSVSFGSG